MTHLREAAAEGLTERACLVALALAPGIGEKRFAALVTRFGSARAAWAAPARELAVAARLGSVTAARVEVWRKAVQPARLLGSIETRGISTLVALDDAYPADLRSNANSPPVLFFRGDPDDLRLPAVAVVGTRGATPYGLEATAVIAGELARARVAVVSGLARGIDSAAHEAALEAGGTTVAVLGYGLDHVPRRSARQLLTRILDGGGLVISQFAPDTLPDKGTFIARNRVVAGMTRAVVVTEAPADSGALRTADFASRAGRKVFVVPGPVTAATYAGNMRLLRHGARAVSSGVDILEDLGLPGGSDCRGIVSSELAGAAGRGRASTTGGGCGGRGRRASGRGDYLPLGARRVLAVMMPGEAVSFEVLGARAGLNADDLGAALGFLEVSGCIERLPGRRYVTGSSFGRPRTTGEDG